MKKLGQVDDRYLFYHRVMFCDRLPVDIIKLGRHLGIRFPWL